MSLRVFAFTKNLLSIYYEIVNCIKSNNFEVITYCLHVYSGDNEPCREKPGYKNRQSQSVLQCDSNITLVFLLQRLDYAILKQASDVRALRLPLYSNSFAEMAWLQKYFP